MADYNELRRKFPPKKSVWDPSTAPMHRRSSRAAVKAVAREYEMKRAELQGAGAPTLRRGPLFYFLVVLGLLAVGGLVLSASKGELGLGRRRIERKALQARKSMDALAVALGRYRFHTGEYPATDEGLAALAARMWPRKGWDGPYVNHVVDDPWGHPYVYETRPEGGHPVLYSLGPDGRAGTLDDVLPDQGSFELPFRDTTWTNGWAPYRLRGVVVAPDEATKLRLQEEMRRFDPR